MGKEEKNKISGQDKFSDDVKDPISYLRTKINAEVVTNVAGSLEAGGLLGYPKSLLVVINVMKS
jgi:hypothetical protein